MVNQATDRPMPGQPVMEIFKIFNFEAAHRLPNVPEGHRDGQLHGHSYSVEVWIKGLVESHAGWVMDLGSLKHAFQPLYIQMDQHYLNEVEGLENPTCENMACWIWQRLCPVLPGLSKVIIHETCTCGCVYQGEIA